LISDKRIKVSKTDLNELFKQYGHCLQHVDYQELNIRDRLSKIGIVSSRTKPEDKIHYFNQLVQYLKEKKITIISNNELIKLMKDKFGVNISSNNISELGLREILINQGIKSKFDSMSKIEIIDCAINYILDHDIEIKNVVDIFKIAANFGEISRGTIDLNLDYIQTKIDIKNIKSTKKLKALKLNDEEIIVESAKHFTKQNIYKITASEFRAHTHSYYRTVNINIIYNYAEFLKTKYDIKLIGRATLKDENVNHDVDSIINFLKSTKKRFKTTKIKSIIGIKEISDEFIILSNLEDKLSKLWKQYISDYVKWLAENRINVKNGLLDSENNLKIDTEKKQLIMLSHPKVNIEILNFTDFIHLTLLKNTASQKAYGVHIQNMYIGFLLFLHAQNKIILPFSYVFDVCYADRKVQSELPYYLSNNTINKALLDSINENRLNVKDDKYKRIFQFFLLTLAEDISINNIRFEHLVPLLDRNKNDFKRVSEILNTLGANIVIDKPKMKYRDRYIKYAKMEKYKKLAELFNKAMNRAYKLDSYSKEENVYKNWSSEYANFFEFIESNYSNENINESFLYKVFDYPDEEHIFTYQEYVSDLKLTASTKDKRLTPLIFAFNNIPTYKSLTNLKDKKPIFEDSSEKEDTRKKRGPITNPLALEKIEDILRNRPPKSDYYKKLNIDENYTNWWQNYNIVAPFEPLILLMHLYIPARGINFRLADRNSFLVKNEQGKVTGYYFTHDKNKKRKTPYIAPNIWGDDLAIIENFIEYSKIHFNHQKPIKYDKQNPNGIVPLFPNAKGTGFYTEDQHMKYWKRVLLKAQVELNNVGNEENIILIYSNNPDIKLPQESFAVDNLSQGDMENFTVRYDLHSLRHTGATKYANAGMPLKLLMLLTGHIDPNVLQSVYIEIDIEKMIKTWEELQNTNLEGMKLSEAGNKLISRVKTKTKEMLQENNPEKLLEFLQKEKFISIGSYLNSDKLSQYSMEDFSKVDPIFWNFDRGPGICTSSVCPQGLENRCSLCPHFITSPVFMHEISIHINLQNARLSKYINMIIENRENGYRERNEEIRKSAQVELEDMLGWTEIIKSLDEIRVNHISKSNEISSDRRVIESNMTVEPLYTLAPIRNSDHSLLKLVYDGVELKKYDHESMQDASEKLVAKLIRYAARNGIFEEIDGKDKYEIFEWFRPVYNEVIALEKDKNSDTRLLNILNMLSDKPVSNSLENRNKKRIEYEE
jgi:ribosomal protein L7/L12